MDIGANTPQEPEDATPRVAAPAEFDPAEVGAGLREVRLAQQRELSDVAGDLRIRQIYIQAIEDGRLSDLPGPAYTTGFLRAYSDYLGLDGREIVDRFKAAGGPSVGQTDLHLPSPVQEGRLPTGSVLLLAALLAVSAYGGWYYMASTGGDPVEKVAALPEHLAILIGEPTAATTEPTAATTEPTAATTEPTAATTEPTAATTEPTAATTEPTAATTEPTAATTDRPSPRRRRPSPRRRRPSPRRRRPSPRRRRPSPRRRRPSPRRRRPSPRRRPSRQRRRPSRRHGRCRRTGMPPPYRPARPKAARKPARRPSPLRPMPRRHRLRGGSPHHRFARSSAADRRIPKASAPPQAALPARYRTTPARSRLPFWNAPRSPPTPQPRHGRTAPGRAPRHRVGRASATPSRDRPWSHPRPAAA